MPVQKFCVTCKKCFSCKSSLNRHVKSVHDSQRFVRRCAESEPGAVDKNNHPTNKVRRCLFSEDSDDENDKLLLSKLLEDVEKLKNSRFTEDINEEIDLLVLSKQIAYMENVAMDADDHSIYLKLKLHHLTRKIKLKLNRYTSNSGTEETKKIFDSDIDEALKLITFIREIVSHTIKRMETHKLKFDPTEIFLMRNNNEELKKFLIKLCDTVEKTKEISRSLKNNVGDAVRSL